MSRIKITKNYQKGDSGDEIAALRAYLESFGYALQIELPDERRILFDDTVETAVERLQSVFGLPITGKIDAQTRWVIEQPRCGNADQIGEDRDLVPDRKWHKTNLVYHVRNVPEYLNYEKVVAAFEESFNNWLGGCDLPLKIILGADEDRPDIKISWGAVDKKAGYVLAWSGLPPKESSTPGKGLPVNIIFDRNEIWGVNCNIWEEKDLLSVAIHEIGHVLGAANHSQACGSMMYSLYTGPKQALTREDINRLKELYEVGQAVQN